jgi:hypothetical protein
MDELQMMAEPAGASTKTSFGYGADKSFGMRASSSFDKAFCSQSPMFT